MPVVRLRDGKLDALIERHRAKRVNKWRRNQMKGRKPKKVDSTETLLRRGIDHPDTIRELNQR